MNRSAHDTALVRGIEDGTAASPRPDPLWTLRLSGDAPAWRRFLHGFLLHGVIATAMLRDPARRRRFLRVTLVQAIVTLVLALLFVPVQRYLHEATEEVEREAEAALQQTLGVVQAGLANAVDRGAAKDATRTAAASPSGAAADGDADAADPLAHALALREKEFRSEVEALRVFDPPPPPAQRGPPGSRVPSVRPTPPAPPAPPAPQVPAVAAVPSADDAHLQELVERAREAADEARALADEGEGTRAQVKQLEASAVMQQREVEQIRIELERALGQHQAQVSAAIAQLEKSAAAQERTRPDLARELRAEARALKQEADDRERELKADARERQQDAQQVSRELRRDAAELEREVAARKREAQQQQRQRQAEQLARSAELVAREAALHATESLRLRVEGRPTASPEELEAQLSALEQRLEAAEDDEGRAPDERAQAAMSVAIEASFVAQRAADERRSLTRELPRSGRALDEDRREELDDRIADYLEVAEEARELARTARAEAKSALTLIAAASRELEPAQRRIVAAVDELSPRAQLALFFAALYAGLYLVQTIVIAFAREYHEAFSRDASLATGIAPEDPERQPRVRLDLRWLRTRMWRRWRALKLFALGLPVLYALTVWLPDGEWLRNVAFSLWGAYWFGVFVAAKSARAWVDEGVAAEPWFLRGATALARRFRLLGTAPFRAYAWLWRRHGQSVFAPAECVEHQPWEFAGLTLFRFLASFPLVKLFFRPFTPVASAHLLESYRVHHPSRRRLDPATLTGTAWD